MRLVRNGKPRTIDKYKFWFKKSALEKIGRHLTMFVDRKELTGKNGGSVKLETIWEQIKGSGTGAGRRRPMDED